LSGRIPVAADISQFFHAIRPDWQFGDKPTPSWSREIKPLCIVGKYGYAVKEIKDYIERAWIDTNSGPSSGMRQAPVAAFVADWVNRYAKLYGWEDDKIMRMPIARLVQLDRVDRNNEGDKTATVDCVVDLMVEQLNEMKKATE
jgi:hypothetical protein